MKIALAKKAPNPLATEAGFVGLYNRHAEAVLVFLARRVFDIEVAFDLMAETFAEAFRSRHRFRGTSEAEQAAWLYAIARHQLSAYVRHGKAERKALRKLAVELPSLSQEELLRVEELADLPALRADVAAGLNRISPQHRVALELRIVDELPYEEIARRLGISETTARSRVSRGLRALGKSLEPVLTAREPVR